MTAVLEPPAPTGGVPRGVPAHVVDAVTRFQAGDHDAFAVIYRHYYTTVIGFLCKRLSNYRMAQAEDLAADAFERAYKRLGTFEWQGRDLGAWLVTIARNLLADYYKSGYFRFVTTVSVAAAASGEAASGEVVGVGCNEEAEESERPEELAVGYMSGRDLAAAVKELGDEQQECIVLRFYRGLSVAETARVMGKNEGAVKSLQYRAVRTLARTAREEGWEW